MQEELTETGMTVPEFLPYHRQLADLLSRHEDGIWAWFASDKLTAQAFDEQRLYLLKSSIRLDEDTHPAIYAVAREVAARLGIDAPVVLHQGMGGNRNAALVYLPDELNIRFDGDILALLDPLETRCLLAHEMAHFLHQTREGQRHFLTDRMLRWICGEPGAHLAHARSLWLSRLYQEIFADRVALAVSGSRDATIATLIKATTGLQQFSVDDYVVQAHKAVALNDDAGSDGSSHPETFIRAIALDAWANDRAAADARLAPLIEGKWRLDQLDLLAQAALSDLTLKLIGAFLAPEWGGSETLEAHARSFDPRFERPMQSDTAGLADIADMGDSLKSYFAQVIADFATVDADLEDVPLLAALAFSARWGFAEAFDAVANTDLGLTKKKLADLRAAAAGAGT
ncbi:hypothetical protein [Tabrizicola sp.]|uniref:hypothetical protein n=1 Tax=Tabrizicola sp. TaxID=2005166 RepID=UPI003F3FF008